MGKNSRISGKSWSLKHWKMRTTATGDSVMTLNDLRAGRSILGASGVAEDGGGSCSVRQTREAVSNVGWPGRQGDKSKRADLLPLDAKLLPDEGGHVLVRFPHELKECLDVLLQLASKQCRHESEEGS